MSGDPARWRDLRLRVMSAAVLAPAALLCVWLGGYWFLGLIVVGLAAMGWEWRGMCGPRRGLRLLGVLYILPGGLALLWLRSDPVAGLGNVMFVLLVVWGSDIGAYLLGRLLGGPKLVRGRWWVNRGAADRLGRDSAGGRRGATGDADRAGARCGSATRRST